MTIKPTRESVLKLITALSADGRSRTPLRTEFAITAILCQINEGIDPCTAGHMHYRDFNFAKKWVDFPPYHATEIVRRSLSEHTSSHLQKMMGITGATAADPICRYSPQKRNYKKWNKTVGGCCGTWVREEIKFAGFDPKQFNPTSLSWIWIDEHLDLHEEEVRTATLARFVMRWAKDFQHEALLERIYDDSPALRPGWAYPKWHKDVVAAAAGAPLSEVPVKETQDAENQSSPTPTLVEITKA